MDNYFELYGLPQHFRQDAAAVKSKYYELSRRYHPDRFATADATTRLEALRLAALNNDAYHTLSHPDRLMAYMLKLHGVLEEEEKYTLPPAFLMEMMELNEAISDYELTPENEAKKQLAYDNWQEQLTSWEQHTLPLLERYDAGDPSRELLLQVKDACFRKKYLLRIGERMAAFSAPDHR